MQPVFMRQRSFMKQQGCVATKSELKCRHANLELLLRSAHCWLPAEASDAIEDPDSDFEEPPPPARPAPAPTAAAAQQAGRQVPVFARRPAPAASQHAADGKAAGAAEGPVAGTPGGPAWEEQTTEAGCSPASKKASALQAWHRQLLPSRYGRRMGAAQHASLAKPRAAALNCNSTPRDARSSLV